MNLTHTSALEEPATTSRASDAEPPRTDGVRDTIESIILAFILAFVFRAFMVEAFVIPTGSMAPGLLGKHGDHRCALCHYPFTYGIRESGMTPEGKIYHGTLESGGPIGVRCPNCGWKGEGNNNLNAGRGSRVVGDAGDRILVLKWPYDLGGPLLGPKRWDVVVFKDPQDGEQNFIKRLLGLPGEVLEIINGDLYTAPLHLVSPDIIESLGKPPLPNQPGYRRLTREQEDRLNAVLRIQRKSLIAQRPLWMVHYDHDFRPDVSRVGLVPDFDPPRWEPEVPVGGSMNDPSPWNVANPNFQFTPRDDREFWIRLVGRPIQDHYAYNDVFVGAARDRPVDVGDVKLSFVLFPGAEVGRPVPAADIADRWIGLSLRKGLDHFEARLHADGSASLDRLDEQRVRIPLASTRRAPLSIDKPLQVEFENLDYRVALRVDGEEILATTDAQYSPRPAELLRPPYRDGSGCRATVRLAAKAIPLEIRHLRVERDVFYRSETVLDADSAIVANKRNPYAQYPGWGTAGNPILLRTDPEEFFCCGDNSPQSKDSRMWWEICPMLEERLKQGRYQLGTVPGDQMIGRAFFVYWPSPYRLSEDTPAFIPNLGRVRIIR